MVETQMTSHQKWPEGLKSASTKEQLDTCPQLRHAGLATWLEGDTRRLYTCWSRGAAAGRARTWLHGDCCETLSTDKWAKLE